VGETRVDLQHLLEDIRDAYPGSLEETIVTEIVANSLDSGATTLRLESDPAAATLTVIDDGSGMVRRDLRRYHDIAASTKSRGDGIGFAGVGIKLGILASEEVFTETRRGQSHVASAWHLASRHKAPWKWVPPRDLVGSHGTAVRLRLRNPLSPLLESGFLETTLRRHFEPLFDATFDPVLGDTYPNGVRFSVNGRALPFAEAGAERAVLAIRLGRKRKPSALGYLVRHADAVPEDHQGIAVSTLGKVIKRGWDWLGFTPGEAARVTGLIEVPGLAGCLTLNKADFIRSGLRGALYLACRKGIQEAVSNQLSAWGDRPDILHEEARRRKTRPVERDLASVLADMADDFPLIASLVEQRVGGQKRLLVPTGGATPSPASLQADAAVGPGDMGSPEGAADASPPPPDASPAADVPAPGSQDDEASTESQPTEGTQPAQVDWPRTGRAKRRPTRLGLTLQFENRPDDPSLGRLVDTTVFVNDAHPAYRRAAASRAEGYHLALTVAMALAPLAVEPDQGHAFVTAFLARWGEALDGSPAHERRTAQAARRTR